jgi:F-type H+-transporting ATPase subunit b
MTTATSPEATLSADDASGASFSATPSVTTVATLVPGQAVAETHELKSHDAMAATTETVGAEGHHDAKEGGLPQLDTNHWAGQMVWLVVIFLVFLLLMSKVFVPRLRKVIDTRGATIAEDLANARANRDEAEAQAKQAATETTEAHAAARKLAAEALARSNAEVAAATAAEDEKLGKRLGEAETRIRAQRDEAMGHVSDIAQETASLLVQKLTGKAATAAALKSALGKV